MVIWTRTVKSNWRGLIRSSKLPVCAIIQLQIGTEPDFIFFCPTAHFYLSLQNGQSQPSFLCDTYCMNTLNFICKKTTVNVYGVVYWKLYLHMRLYVSHYTDFWYCISPTSVNFTGLGPYCHIASAEPYNRGLSWLVSAGAAVMAAPCSWAETNM